MYSWKKVKDRMFFVLILTISILAITPIIHMMVAVLANGFPMILKVGWGFFVKTPPTPLSQDIGGIAPSLIGTAILTLVSLPITIVLALFSAILVNEFPRNPLSIAIDVVAKSLASIPTIAVSMVIYILVVVPMGRFSALAGAIALTIVALPYAYTYISTVLGSIPLTYREAAYSIAMSRWKTIVKVLLPIAKRGFAIGILMTMARILGETAALLFVVGRYRTATSISIIEPVDAIPLLIFDYILTPYPIMQQIAWASAAFLLLIYITIFIAIKIIVKEVRL